MFTAIGKFDLESYNRSLKELIFKHSMHFDVVDVKELKFLNTFYMDIPDYLEDFKIYIGSEEDMNHIESRIPDLNIIWRMQKVYVLETSGVKYYVGASKATIRRNGSEEEYSIT